MQHNHRIRRLGVGLVASLALVAAACGSDGESDSSPAGTDGNSSETSPDGSTSGSAASGVFDPATAGDSTLEVWTAEYGTRLEVVESRIDAFETAYPNVTVNLTVRDFSAYPAQLKLALSGDDGPDVAIGNIGWSLDGPLIKAGLLRDLTPWVEAYGWDQRYSEVAQRQLRFSVDGTTFGDGPIFGIPYAADVIGWFYNIDKLEALGLEPPETFADLEAAFAVAKAADEVPMMLGNKDQWPGLHVFFTVNNNLCSTEEVTGIVFANDNASWTNDCFVESASKLAEWNDEGFFNEGFNGLAPTDANVKFADGEGVFLPAGSWNAAEFADTMGDNVGFFLTPPNEVGTPRRATGSFGYGWHISAASEQPDLSAALIDWLTNEDTANAFFAIGDIAPLEVSETPTFPSQLGADIFEEWKGVLANDTLLPYLDFSDPNGGEVIFPTMQLILSGETDPADGLADIEDARQDFLSSLK